jgi:hypothetical protein
MDRDDAGGVGFMEAMVAMMVVVTALTVYLSSTGATLMASEDPMVGFDADILGYDYADGKLDARTEEYIRGFLDGGSASGVVVTVSMPGMDFVERTFSYGDITAHRASCRCIGLTECASGRWTVTVFGVTVCA